LGPILVHFGGLWGGQKLGCCDPHSVWKLTFFGMSLWCRFGSPPRRPKRHSRGPKTPPRAPKEPPRGRQERPRRLREGLKSTPGSSKRAPRDPKSRSSALYNSKDALHICTCINRCLFVSMKRSQMHVRAHESPRLLCGLLWLPDGLI
jgi:hypothetical protein